MSEHGETYTDEQLAGVVAGLSPAMRRALRGDDKWPMARTVKALRSRGLWRRVSWARTPRGEAVREYLLERDRKRARLAAEVSEVRREDEMLQSLARDSARQVLFMVGVEGMDYAVGRHGGFVVAEHEGRMVVSEYYLAGPRHREAVSKAVRKYTEARP